MMNRTTVQSEPEIDFRRLHQRDREEVVRWFDAYSDPVYGFIFYWVGRDAYIARAWPQPDAEGFSVGFMLTEEGSLKLARLTKSHIGEYVAIMVDGRVMSAPKIMDEITGGRAVINGEFTEEEAESLAEGITMK
jgi:hypothetical protein